MWRGLYLIGMSATSWATKDEKRSVSIIDAFWKPRGRDELDPETETSVTVDGLMSSVEGAITDSKYVHFPVSVTPALPRLVLHQLAFTQAPTSARHQESEARDTPSTDGKARQNPRQCSSHHLSAFPSHFT